MLRLTLWLIAIWLALVAVGQFQPDVADQVRTTVGQLDDWVWGIGFVAVYMLTFVVLPGSFAYLLARLSRKLGQKVYDIKAANLYKDIIEKREEEFCIFLRPFYVTGELFEQEQTSPVMPGTWMRMGRYEFE